MYAWKFTRYLILTCSFSFPCLQKVDHVNNYSKRPILAFSGDPVLRWLQSHRALERWAFIFPWLNSLFSIKVLIIVNSRLVDITLLRISRWYGSSSIPGENDWNKFGSPLQTLYVKDSPSPGYTQLREILYRSVCLYTKRTFNWMFWKTTGVWSLHFKFLNDNEIHTVLFG